MKIRDTNLYLDDIREQERYYAIMYILLVKIYLQMAFDIYFIIII